jgi:preprotein translocase subunit SecB
VEISLHPIQLNFVAVRELFIETFYHSSPAFIFEPESGNLLTESGEFDPSRNIVQVGLYYTIGIDHTPTEEEAEELRNASKMPYRLRVHLIGEFQIDTDRFPIDKIGLWAKANAPALLFPYLREQVSALTVRCGLPPLILPMIVLPPTRNGSPKTPIEESKTPAPGLS